MITAFLIEYTVQQNCSKREFYPDLCASVMLALACIRPIT